MLRSLPILILLSFLPAYAQLNGPVEFRYGYGGFAIRAGAPSNEQSLGFSLDEYTVWGTAFIWDKDYYKMRVSVCSAVKTQVSNMKVENAAVLSKWKTAYLKKMADGNLVQEKQYVFQGSSGTELIFDSKNSITRLFSIKSLLIEETITVSDRNYLTDARKTLDSIRLLSGPERTLAMIEEFSPPALSQEKPTTSPISDAVEQGLQGAVRRVSDTFQSDPKSEVRAYQETQFDLDGFTFVNILFNNGFPDVITSWGWEKGKRINLQSAVNFPPGDGPGGGRSVMVSGALTAPGYVTTAPGRRYGNLIESKWDERGRPLERKLYASSGQLVSIESYNYQGSRCEIKTVDDTGGFIGRVRYLLDLHNNILESETMLDNGTAISTVHFEYQFDNKGNWIVKKAFRKSTIGGRTVLKPIGIYYRNISYYEDPDTRQIG